MGAENLRQLGTCCVGEPRWPVRTCDDFRLVGLKLIFIIVSCSETRFRALTGFGYAIDSVAVSIAR